MTRPTRVLVVDDQEEIRDLVRAVLTRAGFDVEAVASGSDGLRAARSTYPDLVLLDINMPGMDGWETLRLLRADGRTEAIRVAMFSVKSEVRDKVLGMQEGAVDFVTKPFEVDELVDRVRRILGATPGTLSASSPEAR